MRFVAAISGIVLACVTVTGCTRVDKFDIVVRNETTEPLTVVLTKDGPPFESKWAAPEDLAIESPKADEEHGFVVLPPGREADVSLEGRFDRSSRGVLRVYRGELDISTMNAIRPSSPDRLDVMLQPGLNRLVIADRDGRLKHVQNAGPATTPK
jgi:hypothetical protein